MHRIRRRGEVAVHPLRVGLVVVGGDQQQGVRAHVLVLHALLQLGGGAVGAAAHDHRHPSVHHLDGMGHHGGVLLMGHGGVLPGGAQGQNGIGARLNLPLQQPGQHLKVDAAVLMIRGDHGDDGACDVLKFHVFILRTLPHWA